MVCNSCGEKPKNTAKDFTKAVVEINNPDKLVLFRKVVVPVSMGTEEDFPASVGKYYNVLLQYEANGDMYLYSSDGIPTKLSSDVSELQHELEQLGIKVDGEILARIAADSALEDSITALDDSLSTVAKTGDYNDLTNKPTIGNATLTIKRNNANVGTFTANATANKSIDISVPTKTSDIANDGSDGSSTYVESDELSAVATSGSYNDLLNKPTIGNATLTIKKNNANVGTFTANATSNKSINITVPTKTSELTNTGSDNTSAYVEADELATVATTGNYNDLTNKPTIGNATLTIKRNSTQLGTFKANATSGTTVDISVPTKTSDLTNDGADGTSTFVETDDLPVVDTTYSASSNNAIANSIVTNSLNRDVMTNLTLDTSPSTTTVNLNNTKTNLASPSSTTTTAITLPVASSTQAGVMNSSTFDAVTNNTNNINALLSGAVAVTGLPASPTQAQITSAWQSETGLSSLINRASVYDVTNNKVWTYYTNDTTWHAASNTSQVTVNTFTNSSEGVIKGSTNAGQVFAENDGTGSVNGWDTLTGTVANHTSKLATIEQGAEVNVQSNWTQTNTSADDYIKNKPANLVQDANYVHTDNNFTTTLKNKLNGIESGAEVNQNAFSNVSVNGVTVAADVKTDTLTLAAGNNVTLTGDASNDTVTISSTDTNTTYSFANGTNGFTVTPSGGSAQTITVTPSIADATTTDDGLMSAADKAKLNSIASGAEVNVQSDWNISDNTSDAYIKNKPTIPTVNNATLTIQKNGTNVQTFTANSSTNKTANITVPTAVSELTNDANYATTTQLNNGLATKQNTLTAGNAIDITEDVISADVYPADFFTNTTETVTAEGTDVMLSGTSDAKFVEIKPEGDLNQPVSTGINLIDLVPITNGTFTIQGCTTKVEMDEKLKKYVLHITSTGQFPTVNIDFPARLESGKYYVFKYTYRSSTSGANDSQKKLWFGPNWSANVWDNAAVFNNTRCKTADGATTLDIPESKEWTTTARRFYVDPTQYAIDSHPYKRVQLSLGYGIGYGSITSKEAWIADVMVYEITQAEWNESSYTSVDYQPYTNGVAGPSPDAPINVNVTTGAQTIKVANQNLIPFPYHSSGTTSRGVTFTSNSDGSVIVNGQNDGTNQSVYFLYNKGDGANNSGNRILLPAGAYYMPKPSNTAIEYVVYGNNQYYGLNDRNNYTVTLPIDTYVRQIYVQVPTRQSSVQFNNVKIFPMLAAMSGQTEKDYQKQSVQTYDLGINKNMLDLSLFKMGGMAQGQATDEDYRINNADNPIKVKPNTIYTISVKLGESVKGYRVGIHECAADGTFIRDLSWQQLVPNGYTFTTHSDTYTIKLVGSLSTTSTTVTTGSTESKTHFSSLVDFQRGCGLQLELGEKATNYVPVQKNLLDPGMMAVGYVGNDGKLVYGYATDDMCMPFFIPINPSSKVTIKIYETPSTNAPWFGMCEYSQADESSFITRQVNQTAGITSATFTVGENTHFIRVSARNLWKAKYMMVYGDTAPEQYTPYIDSLRKIDDHKDSFIKENGNWYLHRETGKANIAGIENINKSGVTDNNSYYYAEGANPRYRFWDIDRSEIGTSPQSISAIKIYTRNFPATNPYHVCHENSIGISFNKITGDTSKIECRIGVGLSSPLNTDTLFKEWIVQNTLTVYYKLATPTNTKITDTDLIDQLEALANANSYRGTTHIDTTSDGYNLPMILTAEACTNSLAGISKAIDGKQNKLTAGENITIDANNVISATATGNSTITMTDTDPGEGQPLADDNYIAVYGGSGRGGFSRYTANQSIPAATVTTLLPDTTQTPDDGISYANGVAVIQKAGWWMFSATVGGAQTAAGYLTVGIAVNNVVVSSAAGATTANFTHCRNVIWAGKLSVGDTVKVQVSTQSAMSITKRERGVFCGVLVSED